MKLPLVLTPAHLLGRLHQEDTPAPLAGATMYLAQEIGAGLSYTFPCGALADARYLTADTLLDGNQLAVFALYLQEGAEGPTFVLSYGLITQCTARLRMPLEAVNQNRWRYEREGAWLKPLCGGQRVDLRKVDRLRLGVLRKGPQPVRFCLTPITATAEEPPLLTTLTLPAGKLLDEMGQSTLHEWPTKSRHPAEVTERLQTQLAAAPEQRLPQDFSRWGGWLGKRFAATGFFRTQRDPSRWWLVDPDGYAFWSSGLDCVSLGIDTAYEGLEAALTWLPDADGPYAQAHHERGEGRAFDYLKANFIRAFGPEAAHDKWSTMTVGLLRQFGFNTVANWSDWRIARDAQVPYVRPLDGRALSVPTVYRDFPDVFHPDGERAKAAFAEQLRETRDDPAFIGYFLMNEPDWGFAQETPAAGMLFNTPKCYTRQALSIFLRGRYGDEERLSDAWQIGVTFAALAEGEWNIPLTARAQADLADFSAIMVERLFSGLSAACREVDPHHLNLGIRYYTVPPAWAIKGMRSFDVFSMNCYRTRVPAEEMAQINTRLDLPIMIGEWHFGALDVGLPASGIGHVPTQADRGKAFRVYLEDAAAQPWCVGVHYFTLYDQSALGRFDGENYNIGFLDTCNRPYAPLAEAARLSHERLYQVATGAVAPYDEAPEYLPLLFM
ncbi:MAG TPA: hypothetical protein PLH19_09380 [Anaerolineae bacterium]|nr:hypothetical protein [Anaerolineae bacterium]HQH38729.1 hypothetical protein [Anaerolineae bacterium]